MDTCHFLHLSYVNPRYTSSSFAFAQLHEKPKFETEVFLSKKVLKDS